MKKKGYCWHKSTYSVRKNTKVPWRKTVNFRI